MSRSTSSSVFDDEATMKQDLAEYLRTQFKVNTNLPVKVQHGEIGIGGDYKADVVVELGGEYVLAVETKNHTDVRKAIGQAATYRAHGVPSAVAAPGPLNDAKQKAVIESGMWLFEYYGHEVSEHRGLGSQYWEVLDRFEARIIKSQELQLPVFSHDLLDRHITVGWTTPESDVVHADKLCAGTGAVAVDMNDVEKRCCKKCKPR